MKIENKKRAEEIINSINELEPLRKAFVSFSEKDLKAMHRDSKITISYKDVVANCFYMSDISIPLFAAQKSVFNKIVLSELVVFAKGVANQLDIQINNLKKELETL